MTEGFIKWGDEIKNMLEKRIGKHVIVELIKEGTPFSNEKDVITIAITFPFGNLFWCSFYQIEFDKNNYHQRRKLVKIRRQNMMRDIRDYCKKMLLVAKKLD